MAKVRPAKEVIVQFKPEKVRVHVLVGLPFYSGLAPESVEVRDKCLDIAKDVAATYIMRGEAFLAGNFNTLMCHARNHHLSCVCGWRGSTRDGKCWRCRAVARVEIDRFCMIHGDIRIRDPFWLNRLVAEQDKCGADLLGVVMPIKDDRDLTSTAMEHIETENVRRLTMREVCKLAPDATFDAAGAGFPDYRIMTGTSLWIIKLGLPWIHDVWFEVRDRVVQEPGDGQWISQYTPEDWLFAKRMHLLGRSVMATKCITADHFGKYMYPNDVPSGDQKSLALSEDDQTGTPMWWGLGNSVRKYETQRFGRKLMKFSLTILERMKLGGIIPLTGNFSTLRITNKLRNILSFTEHELDKFGIVTTLRPTGQEWTVWNPVYDKETRDFDLGMGAVEIIRKTLKDMEKTEQLTADMVSLYEKFIDVDAEPAESNCERLHDERKNGDTTNGAAPSSTTANIPKVGAKA